VANTLKLHRNGAVGFIDWLGSSRLQSELEEAISRLHAAGVLRFELMASRPRSRCPFAPARRRAAQRSRRARIFPPAARPCRSPRRSLRLRRHRRHRSRADPDRRTGSRRVTWGRSRGRESPPGVCRSRTPDRNRSTSRACALRLSWQRSLQLRLDFETRAHQQACHCAECLTRTR
jgi:hypothetical protein